MGKAQRDRGANGERELAHILRENGFPDAARGCQYCGLKGNADVVGLSGIHIESKRTNRLQLYAAIEQAERDARPGEMPAVFSRADRREWIVSMPFSDWITLYKQAANRRPERGKNET